MHPTVSGCRGGSAGEDALPDATDTLAMQYIDVRVRPFALTMMLAMGGACVQTVDRKIGADVPTVLAVPRVSELRALVPREATTLRVSVKAGVAPNAYWLIDTCAYAAQPAKDETCTPLRPRLDEAGFQALAKWRWIKQNWLRANRPAEMERSPTQRLFVDALGSAVPSPMELFALAFLDSQDLSQGLRRSRSPTCCS